MRSEDGSASVEFVWLTVLLLVPLVYIMLAVFEVQRAAYGTSAATRSAARAFLQSDDVASAERRATAAAKLSMRDQGVELTRVRMWCLPDANSCLQPGSSVRVRIETKRRLPLTPRVLGSDLGSVTVSSTHTQPFGSYREAR